MLLLAAVAVGMAFGANAQEKKVSFGVRAGMNISGINDKYTGELDGASASDYESDFKSRVGFHVGVVMDWQLAGNFYLQPGLYYTTRGGKIDESQEDYKYEEKWRMGYLQLPVLASYRFNISDKVKWHVNAGPYVALGLGGKVKYNDDGDKYDIKMFGTTPDDAEDDSDYKNGIKRFDAGLSFGMGVSINKVYVGVVYDLGLCNIADKDAWKDYKIRNRNFAITVGYNF